MSQATKHANVIGQKKELHVARLVWTVAVVVLEAVDAKVVVPVPARNGLKDVPYCMFKVFGGFALWVRGVMGKLKV